ncbi:hypothetical protein [Massilia sp. Root418]|uniref:hypothetical protein n=1 Tax=Massilia sp. Root418 TaxID=1736532 RepID=UPI000A3FCB97|nr:hypothetical protein [Massilia sp. Root418]
MPLSVVSPTVRSFLPAVAALFTLAALGGCSTAKTFNNALEEPVAALAKAAAVVQAAESDVIQANALGLVEQPAANPQSLVCGAPEGLSATAADLQQFSDALETVSKVATKPDDTSFAGYVKQIRKNKEAQANADGAPGAELQAAAKKKKDNFNRCMALFAADTAANAKLSADPALNATAIAPVVGLIMAWGDLAKELLKYGEAAQREKAVRATVASLLPQLEEARKELAEDTKDGKFGSKVVYPASASPLATQMNRSNLGASITIRRWMTAKSIRANWDSLAPCRSAATPRNCLASAADRAAAAELSLQIANYRSLYKIDDKKILDALKAGLDQAQKANASVSLPDLMDALMGIGDAVTSISDKVDAVHKARDN